MFGRRGAYVVTDGRGVKWLRCDRCRVRRMLPVTVNAGREAKRHVCK